MSLDAIDVMLRANEVLLKFIGPRCRANQARAFLHVAINGPSTIVEVANATDATPEAARRILNNLGDTKARGGLGPRLVEKCRLEERPGLFFKLTARGVFAVEELAEACQAPVEVEGLSSVDDDDADMLDEWMSSRDFVRG
ncbi:hypothetical protein [Novosphingobium sp. PhB57]|uniref:hypothetical protein n=1 Tax=Novosphingobium sp. PhB57 TaxID=2485107 RepID=UPI0010439CC1|nr:hypothetical protein [Novosphingobium sp. PhB57]